MRKYYAILFFSLLSCSLAFAQADTIKYLLLGHTYEQENRVDHRIEKLAFEQYDGILLGGDLCSETMRDRSTLVYLDSLFDLDSPTTFWTLGNHDVRNFNADWYFEFTKKKSYHTTSLHDAVFMVLNTTLNLSNCEDLNEQFYLLEKICDTIQESKYLILFQHHNFWKGIPGISNVLNKAHANIENFKVNCDDFNASFFNAIYPKLKSVQNRGIQVICILGDASDSAAAYSSDGILFIASGLRTSSTTRVGILSLIPQSGELMWEFPDLDVLSGG